MRTESSYDRLKRGVATFQPEDDEERQHLGDLASALRVIEAADELRRTVYLAMREGDAHVGVFAKDEEATRGALDAFFGRAEEQKR